MKTTFKLHPKTISLFTCLLIFLNSLTAAAEVTQGNLEQEALHIAEKYEDQVPDIKKYFEHISYPLIQNLIERQILRTEVISSLPLDQPLNREQLFKLYLEFAIKDKKLPTPEKAPFFDIPTTHPFAKEANYLLYTGTYKGHLGYFHPEEIVTQKEIKTTFPGIDDVFIEDQYTPLMLSTALNHFYRYFKIEFISNSKYTTPTNITIDNQHFYNNNTKIQGLFVHWHTIGSNYSDKEIRAEIKKMKQVGIIGISTEVRWEKIESKEGEFTFPRIPDSVARIAEEEGMWITFLLSVHDVPQWIYDKYGDDVKIHNAQNSPQDRNAFMSFSIFSPVVEEQIKFQQESIKHYQKYNNILAFLLTNEPGYDHDSLGDYSKYALEKWGKWCAKKQLKNCEAPKARTDQNYPEWLEFQQQSLNEYLNITYQEAKKSLNRFIPLGHKIVPYLFPDSTIANIGLRLTPGQATWDFIAADTYGFIPQIYPYLQGFKKPLFIAETNLQKGWDRTDFYRFLLFQYLNGASIQTIYKWDYSLDPFSLFTPSGNLTENTHALSKAIYAIDILKEKIHFKPENTALLTLKSLTEENQTIQKSIFDYFATITSQRKNTFGKIIWSDDFTPAKTNQIDLTTVTKIFVTPTKTPKPLQESKILENPNIWNWVNHGGLLYLPAELTDTKRKLLFKYGQGQVIFCPIETCLSE